MSQFDLLANRRFLPLFLTQFLGAFNDNLFRNALIIMLTYQQLVLPGVEPDQAVMMCGGIFIFPFFLFSALAGQFADKFSKARLMRLVKAVEIPLMGVAALGFVLQSSTLLMVVLFFMGAQSAAFGPAKFSVLPELLGDKELVGGNALVEMGTFVAILLGIIAGGVLVGFDGGPTIVAVGIVSIAAMGWFASLLIPNTAQANPELKISANPLVPMRTTFRVTSENRPVYLSILGISWFWFFGSTYLSLLPSYCRDILWGERSAFTLYASLFCIGIAAGSLLCDRLSNRRLELGLVPLGSIGMSIFTADLFFVGIPEAPIDGELLSFFEFVSAPGRLRIGFDLAMFSVFGGLYTVPLYTMMQQRTRGDIRARVVGGNNILNAAFMVVASLLGFIALKSGMTIPDILMSLAVMNALVAIYIYTIIPEFLLRLAVWVLANLIYRLHVGGRDNIPTKGAALLVCNHLTYVDWMFVAAACDRPPRFVMYHGFLKLPVVGFFFRGAKIIPIAPAHEDNGVLEQAFDKIAEELENGELVCVFPEGKLSMNGDMSAFRTGVERIVARNPVPVVPMALTGLWGSWFSRLPAGTPRRITGKLWSRVTLTIGEPVAGACVTATNLQASVAKLGGLADPADS